MRHMHKYNPALIIGAGGTGVKALRFIQSLANEIDPDLRQMLKANFLRFVAVDTDAKSNDQIEGLEQNMVQHSYDTSHANEPLPQALHRIEKSWIHLDRRALNHAIPIIHNMQKNPEGADHSDLPLKRIAQWFPPKQPNGDQITLGHSKLSGAAQWRPLGRLSLFLDAARVYNTLSKALQEVQHAIPAGQTVNAYIVCSLAGGTGSGIFWDLAFFLQMLAPNIKTSGLFLLGDPFESVDEAGRIHPNIYGALKEIYYFKNWIRDHKVEYPIGNGKTFKGKESGLLPFDTVYLFQSFPPGFGVTDRPRATIDYTCYRIAQNLLSLLRRDIHKVLDVGANNISSDATSLASQPSQAFCFSTSASIAFPPFESEQLLPFFQNKLLEQLRESLPELSEPVGLSDPPAWLKDNDPWTTFLAAFQEDAKQKSPIATCLKQVEACLSWLSSLDKQDKNLSQDKPDKSLSQSILERLGTTLRTAIQNAKEHNAKEHNAKEHNAKEHNPKNLILKDLQQEVDAHVNKKLQDFFNDLEKKLEQRLKPDSQRPIEGAPVLTQNALTLLTDWHHSLKPQELIELPQQDTLTLQGLNTLTNFTRILEHQEHQEHQEQQEQQEQPSEKRRFTFPLFSPKEGDIRKRCKEFLKELQDALANAANMDLQQARIKEAWNKSLSSFQEKIAQKLADLRQAAEDRKKDEQELKEIKRRIHTWEQPLETKAPPQLQTFLNHLLTHNGTLKSRGSIHQNHADSLMRVLARAYDISFSDQLNHYLEDWELNADQLKKLLEELEEDLRKTSEQGLNNLKHEDFIQFLEKLINCSPHRRQGPDTVASIKNYWQNVQKISESIVTFFNDLANNIMIQSGGVKAFRERLYRCRPNIFVKTRDNDINKKHLVIFPFTSDNDDNNGHDFQQQFILISQDVFHLDPTVIPEKNSSPIIYYEDLFRSADEIAKIHDYLHAYAYDNGDRKPFFHIHPDVAGYPEIVTTSAISPVFCGNPNCTKDIRGLSRKATICTGCKNPIWNRCGNEDCHENQLLSHIERLRANPDPDCQRDAKYTPQLCPACNQLMKTWWWKCPDHQELNPGDKISCVNCTDEHHAGKRASKNIHRRPDRKGVTCPGCKVVTQHCCPVEIPPELRIYFERGVNGHARITFFKLVEKFKSAGIGPFHCTKGSQRHNLFPTCPEPTPHQHHVYLSKSGTWHCTEHPSFQFNQCRVCDYPIWSEAPPDQPCPRCLSPIRHCFYCTPTTGYLETAIPKSEPTRCSYCTNLMDDHSQELFVPKVLNHLKDPAYCPNLFGCKAAAHPWDTAAEYSINQCRVCKKAHLIPRVHLVEEVAHCPLCSLLLTPLPQGLTRKKQSLESLELNSTADRKGPEADKKEQEEEKRGLKRVELEEYWEKQNRRCLVCGTSPWDIFKWIDNTPNDGKTTHIPFKFALEILTNLLRGSNVREIYRGLQQCEPTLSTYLTSENLEGILARFDENALHYAALSHQMTELISEQDRLENRMTDAIGPTNTYPPKDRSQS